MVAMLVLLTVGSIKIERHSMVWCSCKLLRSLVQLSPGAHRCTHALYMVVQACVSL